MVAPRLVHVPGACSEDGGWIAAEATSYAVQRPKPDSARLANPALVGSAGDLLPAAERHIRMVGLTSRDEPMPVQQAGLARNDDASVGSVRSLTRTALIPQRAQLFPRSHSHGAVTELAPRDRLAPTAA